MVGRVRGGVPLLRAHQASRHGQPVPRPGHRIPARILGHLPANVRPQRMALRGTTPAAAQDRIHRQRQTPDPVGDLPRPLRPLPRDPPPATCWASGSATSVNAARRTTSNPTGAPNSTPGTWCGRATTTSGGTYGSRYSPTTAAHMATAACRPPTKHQVPNVVHWDTGSANNCPKPAMGSSALRSVGVDLADTHSAQGLAQRC